MDKEYVQSAVYAIKSGRYGGISVLKRCLRQVDPRPRIKDSTTSGMQLQPSSPHTYTPNISCCSVANAAESAVCPASETISGFNGDNTERSNAVSLLFMSQLFTRMHVSRSRSCDQGHCQLPN